MASSPPPQSRLGLGLDEAVGRGDNVAIPNSPARREPPALLLYPSAAREPTSPILESLPAVASDSGVEVSEVEEGPAPSDDDVVVPESTDSETPTARSPPRTTLRRAVSHESIVSLGGLDIHTLRSRPSQLTLGQLGSAQAVLADITAQPTISRSGGRGSSILRDNLAAVAMPKQVAKDTAPRRPWIWRPWKAAAGSEIAAGGEEVAAPAVDAEVSAPLDIPVPAATAAATDAPKDAVKEDLKPTTFKVESVRAPGINQPGAIPGFGEFMAQARRRSGRVAEGE